MEMDFHSMKRKELQALCKKNKIPANLTNLEMANRLTSLWKGKDGLFTERRASLKVMDENGNEIESNVANKRVKKVRFSPHTETFEFEKSKFSAFEVKRRGRRKSVVSEVRVAEHGGGAEISEGVGHATRSRGRKLVQKGAAEKGGGKGGAKDDAFRSNLPSSVDKAASTDVDNEESGMMKRRSLRRREVVDEEKRKREVMEKALKGKERERNLSEGTNKVRDNVAEIGGDDAECVKNRAGKVLGRSKRNVSKWEGCTVTSSGTVATGSSLKPVNTVVCADSGPPGLGIDAAILEMERPPVGVAVRRSRRNASRNGPLITLNGLVAEANYERKMKRQRGNPVEEQEVVLVDSISIELPLAPLSTKAEGIVVGKSGRKSKKKSKMKTVEIEYSLPEDQTTEELPDVDVQQSLAEVGGAIARDSDNEYLLDDLKKQKKRSGNNSSMKSPPKAQSSSKGVNWEITALESTELNSIEPGTETCHCQTNEVDQSDSTDPKGIQVWVELSLDMQTMSRSASLDHIVGDERISSDKNQDYIEHEGLEPLCGDMLERNGNAQGPCEGDVSTSSAKYKTCEVNSTNSEDTYPNHDGECPSMMSSDRSLEQKDLSLRMHTNDVEVDNVRRDRNLDREAVKYTISAKSDENNPLEENYDASDKFYMSDFPEPSRRANRRPEDGNVNGPKDTEQPADKKGEHPGHPSGDVNIVETSCTRVENGICISTSESTTNVLELNLTSKDPVSVTIVEGGHCCLEDTNIQNQEGSADVTDLDKHLEPRKISLIIQQNVVGPDDAVEAEKHFEDAKISEQPNFDKDNILGKFLESNPLDSSRCKLGMSGVLSANVGKDFVGNLDSGSLVSAAEDFASHAIAEKDSYTMNVDTALEQREHSPGVDENACEADIVAEVDMSYGQLDGRPDELSKTIEDRPSYEKYYSHRSTLQNGVDTLDCQKNSTSPGKTFGDGPDKAGNTGFTDSHVIKNCISVQFNNSGEAENPMGAIASATGDCSHIPLVDNNKHNGCKNSDMALNQRGQTPVPQMSACHFDNVTEDDRSHDQLDLFFDESAESPEERCIEEEYRLPNKVSDISYSSGSGSTFLQDKIVRASEAPIKWLEKSNEVETEEDRNAGSIEPDAIARYTATKDYEDNPEISKDVMEEISRTVNFAHNPMVVNNGACSSTKNMEITLEKRPQSLAWQQNGCEADIVAEDGNQKHKELSCVGSVEGRPCKKHCEGPDKYHKRSVSDPSRRILEDRSANAGEDFKKSADLLETSVVTPFLAAEAVEKNCSATEFSSSVSNIRSPDPPDSYAPLDGPERKEVWADVNKSGNATFPDTIAQEQDDIMDAVSDTFKTCKKVHNYVDLASFERRTNNAEDVSVAKFPEVVLAVQRCASLDIDVSDTAAVGIHSPPSYNDEQEQGEETFADNRKKDTDGISDKIPDFGNTGLSEAKFSINNFQGEFSFEGQDDKEKKNLADTLSQVQFTMSEIHSEEKIVDTDNNVSTKLDKHHEILKESDVADTINEYIESESTMNPSLRMDDACDTSHSGMSTKVPKPENKHAEETFDSTRRKSELSVERDDQEKNEVADLEETALGSAWIPDGKTVTAQSKTSGVVTDRNYFLGKQLTSEMMEKNSRAIILINGTPKKLQVVAADMKENLPSFKMEKVGYLTTVKPTTKRPALKDVLQK